MIQPEQLSFRQIRYFEAIADAGSFRRAADRLGVTQPTLTVQIAAMEKALGTALFERQHNGVILTPVGRELLPRARRMAEELKSFFEQAGGAQSMAYQQVRREVFRDYDAMDNDPILASALDIYADESTLKNEFGDTLMVHSDNEKVQDILNNFLKIHRFE